MITKVDSTEVCNSIRRSTREMWNIVNCIYANACNALMCIYIEKKKKNCIAHTIRVKIYASFTYKNR